MKCFDVKAIYSTKSYFILCKPLDKLQTVMYSFDGLWICKWLLVASDVLLCYFYYLYVKPCLFFLDGGNTPIIGLLLLIGDVNEKNEISEFMCI